MKNLYKLIPEAYFAKDLKQNPLNAIKIALLREATGNLVIRSNYADETISLRVGDKDLVEFPARKLKSREKLTGLKICREYEVVDKSLRYNVIKKSQHLANPNSILFGDSVTESNDSVGLRSRVIYDWAYSLRDLSSITEVLQHNALSEGGTMMDEDKGKFRQSLFQTQYVKPGTFFPHFLTVEQVTPELFFHLISTLLHTHRYTAQDTTLGPNLRNHLIGIGFGKFEAPLNSYQLAAEWGEQEVSRETVTAAIEAAMRAHYDKDHYVEGEKVIAWARELWKQPAKLKPHYTKAQKDCEAYLKAIKVWK